MGARLILISGASGGGKSTLLAALGARGYDTVPEPGRRVLAAGGPAPWEDLAGFLAACVDLAVADRAAARARPGPVIFDRGLVDALSGLDALGAPGAEARAGLIAGLRYASPVFLAPPWREIFAGDAARRHGFEDGVAEYARLAEAFPAAGYAVEIIPKIPVDERVAWIAARVGPPGRAGRGMCR